MATNPYPYPLDREIEERLDERGELEFVPHSEIRAMLRELGVPIRDVDPTEIRDARPRRKPFRLADVDLRETGYSAVPAR
jgi:hypothetical protein